MEPPGTSGGVLSRLAAQPAAAQGQPVLESSRPLLASDANDHGATEARRSDAARAATAIATGANSGVKVMGQNGEPHPDLLGVDREPAKPTPHRRDRQPQHRRRTAMTYAGRLGDQRRTNHLGRVASPKQRIAADQHVSRRATNTARATRST